MTAMPDAAIRRTVADRRRVVYVVERPLARRDFERFGIDVMLERDIDVQVVDIADLMYPDAGYGRDHYKDLTEVGTVIAGDDGAVRRLQPLFESADLVLFLAQSRYVLRGNVSALRAVSRSRTPYLLWAGARVPGAELNTFTQRARGGVGRYLKLLLNKNFRDSLIARVPPAVLGIAPAAYFLDSAPSAHRPNVLVGPATRRIDGHAPDYDIYLRDGRPALADKAQIVFIDQFLPLHPDFTASRTATLNPDSYFSMMCDFFARCEAETGCTVVIAGHPRADYSRQDYYRGRRIVFGETARLCAESRLVLAHGSTAIGFAALARKPIMLLPSAVIDRIGIEGLVYKRFSEELGAPIVRIDDPAQTVADKIWMNAALYESYVEKYLKPRGTPDKRLWEIALDAALPNTAADAA